jgi:hypothetical protein
MRLLKIFQRRFRALLILMGKQPSLRLEFSDVLPT